jgi:hypothetical protein
MSFSLLVLILTVAVSSEAAIGSRQENASKIDTLAALRNFKQDFKRAK